MTVNKMIKLRDLKFSEINQNFSIQEHKALIFDTPYQYDGILGSGFLSKGGMNFNYRESVLEEYDSKLALSDPNGLTSRYFKDMDNFLNIQVEDEALGRGWLGSFATEILDADYERANI